MAITLFPDQTGDTTATLPEEPLAAVAQLPVPEAPQQTPAPLVGADTMPAGAVLPQSADPPDLELVFGPEPFDEAAAKKNEDYRKGMDVVDQAVKAPDEFFKGEDMSFAPDHKMAQMMATNDLALSVLTGTSDIPKSGVARRLALLSASIQNFGGQEADTEESFHGLLQKQTLQRTKARGLAVSLASDAERSAISNAGLSQELSGFDFKRFLAQHGDRANEVEADASDLYDLYTKTYADARARIAPFESQLASVSSAMSKGDSLRPAVEQAWSELPPEQRKPFMASLSFFAHNLPIAAQTDFWANLSRSDHRNWDSSKLAAEKALLSGAESDALKASAQHASGMREPDIALMPSAYNTQTEADTRAIAADVHKRRQQLDFAGDVLDMRNSVYEPIHVDPDSFLPSTFQRAVYQGPHMLGTLAVAAVPYAGPAAIFMMAKGNAYSDYRSKFMATMPEEEASAKADGLSNWEAVPETLLMVSGSKVLKGALPFLEPWAQSLINKASTTTGRYLTRAAISSVEESAVVGAQGFVNPAVQSLATLTDPKIPGVRWTGEGGVFDAQWTQFPETFISLVPLIAFGSAMGTAGDNARAEAFRTAPVEHLQALGFSEAQIAARADAVAKGVGATNAWADQSIKNLDPRTSTATAAVEKIRQDFENSQKATEALQDSGDLPVLTRDGATGQWIVHTEGSGADGEDALRAPNRVEAWKLAESHYQAVRDLEAEHIGYMQTSLEAADHAAELPGGGTRSYELNLGKVFTEAMASTNPQAAERYATQVRNREIRDGGDGSFAGIILGTTSDEIARGIKQDVVRLYDGASAPVVFHETTHALRRKALEAGRLTRADDIALVRAYDAVLKDRTAQSGIDPDTGKATRTSLRILPEGIKNSDITEAQLDEAVSEIIESEVLKNRKGGKDRQDSKEGALQLPSGFLTRNLTSIARLAPGAAKKFTAFLNAVRARWGLTLGRALAMKKAEREGRFDSEARANYLNKLLGLDAQAEHEKEADRITRQIIDSGEEPGAPPRSPADDADPFAIGKRGTGSVIGQEKEAGARLKDAEDALRTRAEAEGVEDPAKFASDAAEGNLSAEQRQAMSPELRDLAQRLQETRETSEERASSESENGGPAFSISHNKMVGSVLSAAAARIKEPKARIAFFSRMAKAIGGALRETDEIKQAFGKDYVRKAIVDPATVARIKKEAGIRQAFRRAELEDAAQAKHMGILSSDDLTKLKAQPVHSELSTENPLHGRLRSPSKTEERLRQQGQGELIHGGDYDGSEGVSRSVFGGTLAPDQAAQELYDHGLIKEPTPDAMWDALKREGDSVANMKRYRQAAEADIRQAKVTAKEEADQWTKEALAEQKKHYSTRARLVRAIALLDGIKGALPPEIQARLGGYAQLAKLGSDKAMLDYLTKTIAKASDEVTGWLKREQRADLDKLVEKSRPNKNAPGEAKRGKVGAEAHRMFKWVEKYQDLDQRQVDAERAALAEEQKRIDDETAAGIVHPEALDLANRMRVLDLVGNFDEKSVEGQAAGLTWLHEVYTYGRDEWQATEANRLAGYAKMQRDTLDALAAQIGASLPKLELPEFDRAKLEGKTDEEAEALLRTHETRVKNAMAVHKDSLRTALDVAGLGSLAERQAKAAEALSKPARTAMEGGSGELISFVQALERILPPDHPLVERWNEAVGDAQDQKTDSVLAADKAWNEAAATAIGSKKLIEVKTRLGEMSLKQTISFLKQAGGQPVKIEVPLGDAEGLLDGGIHPGDYSLREEDLPALQDALDTHNARPDDGKGAAGKKAVKFLTVERSSSAEGIPTKLTEMQAMTLLLISRQERYRSNLEKHGFTAFEIENVRAQLSPEAKEMMSFLADYYRDNYEPLAKVFREMFGVDLPPESNYSPGRFERGGADNARGPDDALQEGGFRANFTKTRAPSHDLAPALHNAAAVFQGHVAESEHWRAYAPLVRELKAVLQNLDVAHAIEAVHGEKNLSVINGWIQAFEQNGLKSRQKFDGMNSMWRGLQRNVAVMGLAFRMSSLIKNALLPALGTARRIGNRNWALGLLRFTTGKIDYSRFLHSDLIQRREAYGFSPEARAAAITLASEMPSRPKDAVEWSIRLLGVADARSTALGAAIAWDYHYRENLAQNMSHEEADALASRQTRDDVRRTAQPTQMAEKSLFELSQSELGKLSFMFMSEARKDWAGVQESTRLAWKENGVKGLLTSAQFRRTATTIWLTTGLFSTVISRMLSDALDDGSDEEIFDDKNWNPYAVTASVLLGPMGGMPMVGNIAGGFDRSTMSKVFQGADGLKQIGKALWKQEIPKTDRVGWVERQSKKVLDGVGMFSKSAATVSAVGNAIDQAFRSVHKTK